MITRRKWMIGSAAAAAATQVASGAGKNIAVASGNGKEACAKAMEVMRGGGDTLDAVIAGVNIVEEDPNDTSVGHGGLPNEAGDVELDACVMHGPSRRAGSVASIRGIKTPSKVARLVMEQTDHIMMVSDKKAADGTPLVLHNIGAGAVEEDRLFAFPLTGHYRWFPVAGKP